MTTYNHRCFYEISSPKPQPIFTLHKPRSVHKISPQKTSPLFAVIHLFISSHDEIKDFCSMDKKTGRRYGCACTFIHKLLSQNRPQIISPRKSPPIPFSPSNITPTLHLYKITKKHKFALTIIPENGIINVTGNMDYVCHPHGKTRVIILKIPANFICFFF